MVIETELFDSPDLNPLAFYLSRWMKSKVYRTKSGYKIWIARSHLDAADRTKKREDQLRWTSRDFRTLVAQCVEVHGGILEYLFGL